VIQFSAFVGLLGLIGQTPDQAAPPATKTLFFCYMRQADLSVHDPRYPEGLVGTGLARRLVVEFPTHMDDGHFTGDTVKIDDPTKVLMGRSVRDVTIKGAAIAMMLDGTPTDILALTFKAPDAGTRFSKAYAIWTKSKTIDAWFFGKCYVSLADSEADFDEAVKQPSTREVK
jgi:hypothetical protein